LTAANSINQCGLIAGAIGGETMVLLVLVNSIILMHFAAGKLPQSNSAVTIWTTVYPLLILTVFEIWGVFAAWLAGSNVTSRTDALLVGFIAGTMIGVILEIMWFVNILSLITRDLSQRVDFVGGYANPLITAGVLISLALAGGILSGFGSFIFVLAKKGWNE
jgi:hypothetical protein